MTNTVAIVVAVLTVVGCLGLNAYALFLMKNRTSWFLIGMFSWVFMILSTNVFKCFTQIYRADDTEYMRLRSIGEIIWVITILYYEYTVSHRLRLFQANTKLIYINYVILASIFGTIIAYIVVILSPGLQGSSLPENDISSRIIWFFLYLFVGLGDVGALFICTMIVYINKKNSHSEQLDDEFVRNLKAAFLRISVFLFFELLCGIIASLFMWQVFLDDLRIRGACVDFFILGCAAFSYVAFRNIVEMATHDFSSSATASTSKKVASKASTVSHYARYANSQASAAFE